MTKHVIPDTQHPLVVAAADRAYDAIRWAVGDSWDVAHIVRQLAHECWLAGFEQGKKEPEAAE